MSPGSTCQYITGGEGESLTVAAAIVTDVHSDECVTLAVLPGITDYGDEFSPDELSSGIARRTSVVKGDVPGCWRELPPVFHNTS